MIHTLKSLGGMVVAPHHLAAQAGRAQPERPNDAAPPPCPQEISKCESCFSFLVLPCAIGEA